MTQTRRTAKLAPSILSADFSQLSKQLASCEAAGADYLHVDVMDGQFVPNITIGPLIVEACKRTTNLPLDVHLMIVEPERYIKNFRDAGADHITIHAEATPHAHRALQMIKESGAKTGLVVNPLTPLEVFKEALPMLDIALLMSVNPGFGGQRFIESTLARLKTLSAWRDTLNPACEIEVDGGVKVHNIAEIHAAGADVLVAGSAAFEDGKIQENIAALRQAVAGT